MEYLKSGLKNVLGAPQGSQQPSGAETVERLVERVQTSVLLDDRRDACRALKALSKKFRLEVGAQGMDVLIHVLETDRSDAEILGYALDALNNVIAGVIEEEDITPEMAKESDSLGFQFTEIYIKKPENVSLLLDLLEENEFKVRWPTVKLMTGLLIHRPKEMQECILVSPMGVSRLMDLLVDTREVIRNDALLLLAHLTKGNANIQKIVAFENAFDRLLDIITEEGFSDGGVIVEDCLLVLLNLLKNNVSNQNFFKEGSYIQKLKPFFDLHNDPASGDKGWSPQKVGNIHMMLQLIRTLVSPNNPHQVVAACQKAMFQSELLTQLCNILMASGVPADILTETINTVAEVIRGYHSNQEYLASVTAPANPPRPAIVVLLMSMVNEKQPFVLRCAVLYCFQSFLYKNELGQAQVIQTLLPSKADMTTVTAGQLLCGGLFSGDSLSNWLASVALSHALVDNQTQKEQLLRVQLAMSVGNLPIPLLKQCTTILQQGGKVQTRVGLLMLLSTWLAHVSGAVSQFLSLPTNIPYLTSQVSLAEGDEHEDLVQGLCAFLLGICIEFNDGSDPTFTKESLCQLIVKRVGLETFLNKLGGVTKSDVYSQTVQRPHLKYKQPSEVLLDYEFCRLFKSLEGILIKAVQPKPQGLANGPESSLTAEQCSLLKQYKELIREQDQELSTLRQNLEELERNHQESDAQVKDLTLSIQQLRDQNALLKVHRATTSTNASQATEKQSESDEVQHLKTELEKLNEQNKTLTEQLEEARHSLEQQSKTSEEEAAIPIPSIVLEACDDQISSDVHKAEIETFQKTIQSLEGEMAALKEKNFLTEKLEGEKSALKEENEKMEEELSSIRKEQEDLLVLLTEQDSKLTTYKIRLKELGGKIDDDDDDLQEDESDGQADEDGIEN